MAVPFFVCHAGEVNGPAFRRSCPPAASPPSSSLSAICTPPCRDLLPCTPGPGRLVRKGAPKLEAPGQFRTPDLPARGLRRTAAPSTATGPDRAIPRSGSPAFFARSGGRERRPGDRGDGTRCTVQGGRTKRQQKENEPLRGEILSIEALEEQARVLAARFTLTPERTRGRDVLGRLRESIASLRNAYRLLSEDARRGEVVDPAAEWLLDNFHLLEAESRSVIHDLPTRYYRKLPRLAARELAGQARIHALSVALVQHGDGRLDSDRLTRFIAAFQDVAPLTIGELWAWPSMLRLSLLENVRILGTLILDARDARNRANEMIAALDTSPEPPLPDDFPSAFVEQLRQRLREHDPRVAALCARVDEALEARGTSSEEAVRAEHQREAADLVSMENSITSLRFCGTFDWSRYFEGVSLVEQVLRRDPASAYPQMDFGSRDRYRQAVEELARPSGEAQIGVALRAIESARQAAREFGPSHRAAHVGYHIIGDGRRGLEIDIARRPKLHQRVRRFAFAHATAGYLGSITLLTLLIVSAAWLYAVRIGSPQIALIAALLALIPASELAMQLVQRLAAVLASPRRLPRLDYRDGIPATDRTMVVIPTLFINSDGVHRLLDHLEVQALGNLDDNVHFAILSDFPDADAESLPGDDELLAVAIAGIEELNRRHGGARKDRFFLFHRPRLWNPKEGVFMGWERKRGKVEEFNRLLRGSTQTSFTTRIGDLSILPRVRYVLTLDSDTRLPRDVARTLVGIMSHPLNRPLFDATLGRVVRGYGILQPRVSVTYASSAGSLFARVYAGHTGVDPYTTAVSDTYQDLFAEGSYTGKALYDVDAFSQSLEGRTPDDTLLSHDLFEGLYARTALVTDVELVDDYPANVLAHARRQRRWVRGDWQILRWLLPWVPSREGLARNTLPVISRWKIFDNLRRSLVSPALIVFLAAAWTFLPGSPLLWTLGGLTVVAFPLLMSLFQSMRWPRRENPSRVHLRAVADEISNSFAQALLTLVLLPFHAWEMVQAIAITLVRLALGRRLLEWETAAAQAARLHHAGIASFFREMAASPVAAVMTLALVALIRPEALPVAIPFAILWLFAPLVAYWLSQPIPDDRHELSGDDRELLLDIARKSWGYFETHVGSADHFLPPDNIQEGRDPLVAHRTSPTNIGLALLSTLAAHDLEFLAIAPMVDRLDAMLTTVEGLERYEGHLLNWYDTVTLAPLNPRYVSSVDSGNFAAALLTLAAGCRDLAAGNAELSEKLHGIADRSERFANETSFGFLYEEERGLLSIGYRLADNAGPGTLDHGYYDLLASEARIASFFAIAKGDLRVEHWFHLGRPVVSVDGVPTLLSWSGSMFEYLMPLLLMKTYPGTLLDRTCRAIVRRQIAYGRSRKIPWGISETAYNLADRLGNYQYKAFGVPGLGLKRGLADEVVVTPHATALAALVDPSSAADNFRRLADENTFGAFGYYEAIDYTPRDRHDETKPRPDTHAGVVLQTYFAHHQGMTLVALANVLERDVMIERFHSDARIRATELLLQERTPRAAPIIEPRPAEETHRPPAVPARAPRRIRSPHRHHPSAQILSNGSYTVFVTNSGGGSSLCGDRAVTRWREDLTSDPGSQFLYLRDVHSGEIWSATYQPIGVEGSGYTAEFFADKAVFERRDHEIDLRLEIAVSSEDDAEVRRVALTNRSERTREIEVTSFVEISLASRPEDFAHPAFGKLFVETEWLQPSTALLARRRPRSPDDPPVTAFHVLSFDATTRTRVEWETDRARFLGRGRGPDNPISLDGRPLSETAGAVIDPILSLRTRLRLAPGGFARLSFTTGLASDRTAALAMAQKYHDPGVAARTFSSAYTHNQVALRHLGVSAEEVEVFDRFGSRVFFSDTTLRADPSLLARNELGQAGLWGHSISGDLPLVLVRVTEAGDLALVNQVLRAQEQWRLKGLRADIVILNEHEATYRDELHADLIGAVGLGPFGGWMSKSGGVFLLRADSMPETEITLLATVARATLHGDRGRLDQQLDRGDFEQSKSVPHPLPAALVDEPFEGEEPQAEVAIPPLVMDNGIGGFSNDGKEYVVVLEGDRETPLPWINVLANPLFGSIVTSSGSSHTWAENARENRLTPFANDTVTDPTSEAIFIRDEETGAVWGATPGPLRRSLRSSRWVVRHAAGVTRFSRNAHGFEQELAVFVAKDDPVKLSIVTLKNRSNRTRRLSLFAYNDWWLGPPKPGMSRYVMTEHDAGTGEIFARQLYGEDPSERIAFAAATGPVRSATGDRREFLGRNGSLARASALGQPELQRRFGAGLDPCAAIQVTVELEPGETRQVVFQLGQGANLADARQMLEKYRDPEAAWRELAAVETFWDELLGSIRISTPDDSFDILVNRWLLYQNLAARIWARSGYYQASGAFGFRDQLQDVMALMFVRPDLSREHILRAAARQFVEGDVQHWWNPKSGAGIRTRCSDDLLWLPWATAEYVGATGDESILEVRIPFLEGPPLPDGEAEAFGLPAVSSQEGTLYEHCIRAIEKSLPSGARGLPLIGSCDWNDGYNRIGVEGRGESVFVGWFLHLILGLAAPWCRQRGDHPRADRYLTEQNRLGAMLDQTWDGEWYQRAYFDDGTPLGSSRNSEGKIDSLAQSWAVLSGAAPRERAERAMDAVRAHLVRRASNVVLLLTPPFDTTELDPGYIKGYIPGVRENGGQYTHAAQWVVLALTRLGRGDEAMELFHMLNPINHTRTDADLARYKTEPYAMAGDVYDHPDHRGRGGWTWYTGSAGWLYRVAIEGILGLRRRGAAFEVAPCIPPSWPGFSIEWRFGSSKYLIEVENDAPHYLEVVIAELDGRKVDHRAIPLVDDGADHRLRIVLGARVLAGRE
jgi:cyclic beta-1,2-glucan synthetase